MLKPYDIVVCLKLLTHGESPTTYAVLSTSLGMSVSETHAGVKRALEAGLLRRPAGLGGATMPVPAKSALSEFLVHGMKYVWPATRGVLARGVPTCASQPSVATALNLPEPDMPLVWPDPEGVVRGESIEPLYPKALQLARQDMLMHEWLALLDILRVKTGREAKLAADEIQKRLS